MATTSTSKSSVGRPLVIVESPAKAKTISQFLGDEFVVRASVGHVADLPSKGLAVDVDRGFAPTYELTDRGRQVIKELKADLKNASELYLATDEDREGEAISWHLLENLKPKKGFPVKRMVFHEITRSAIDHAVANPREIDQGLVDAAETRRILDRLYGYEVSPILWRKVNRGLSAGRVQSPSIRLIVERERERMAFVTAGYWSIELDAATSPRFTAKLVAVDGIKVASGKDFGADGHPTDRVVALDEPRATAIADGLTDVAVTVRSVDTKPYRSSPKAPFMTSTLQQEGGRRLRLSSSQVMRVAQGLYERGFITYMRTDSVALSDEAMSATRDTIRNVYGEQFLSDKVRHYASKSKNAQEAHEAIRPTTPFRNPQSISSELDRQELALYTLIWQRTLASQMADARGTTLSLRLGAVSAHESTDCEFSASGTTIEFPGHRAVLSAPSDDDESTEDADEALLPALAVGDTVPAEAFRPDGHTTTPPARYTEASLVKKLEELGIGRPSTWASIIQTIQDRGYVWKKGQALVPTWTAFAVVGLLEHHFTDLVDYELTAKIEEDLDDIAGNRLHKVDWLTRFYFGDTALPGLKKLVEENLDQIDAAAINSFPIGHDSDGVEIVAKPGKYGPYIKRGEDTASIPDDLPPDELTIDEAIRLLSLPKSDEPIGQLAGLPVYAKNGRYGPYVQWGDPDNLPPGMTKPKMSSLFSTMSLEHITMTEAEQLLTLPRTLGVDPADGEEIQAANGRYGPYVVKGRDFRSIESEERLLTITLDQAVEIFRLPKVFRRGGARNMAAAGPLREFGEDPISSRPVVAKDGRFGVYVTDGETNASIGKGDRIEEMLPERAFELLAIRREQGPKKKPAARKRATKKR